MGTIDCKIIDDHSKVTSWWYSQWWRFRQYCTFPISWVHYFFLIFIFFELVLHFFCPGKQFIALLFLLHDWYHYWTSPRFRSRWRSEGVWSRWRPFLASYSVGWGPLSSWNVISDIYWSKFQSGYLLTGLPTGHFCQESLEIWSLSLAVRSRSFYRRTGTESDIREERKSDAAKVDVASSSSLYTNTDRFLPFNYILVVSRLYCLVIRQWFISYETRTIITIQKNFQIESTFKLDYTVCFQKAQSCAV